MTYAELAERLVSAKTDARRIRLFAENRNLANETLAMALKEICYAVWTSEPTRAQNAARAAQRLAELNPTEEIKAVSFWICGIARITEGKLKSAVKNLDKSAALFRKINLEREAAQTQVAKLYPLAVLGRYEAALATGKEALRFFERTGDELAAGKIEKNLGNIVARQGDELAAERYYLSASRRFEKIKNVEELAMSENSLANTYAELNDFRLAEKFYERALNRARAAKMSVTEAEIEASIGNLALFRGKFDRALKFLELSRRKYEILKMPHQTAIAELEIADIYLELNLTNEAFSIYETVADRLGKLKMQGEEARARLNFGRVAVLKNEIEIARQELKKSARLYILEKNRIGAAAVKISEATLELELKNYRKALKLAQEAKSLLKQSKNLRYELIARWLESEARHCLGETAKARESLVRIFTDSIKHEQPNLAQSAQISLGKIAVEEANYKQAEKHFKRAIAMIELLRAPLAAEEFRMAFLANKLAPYENLAKIYLAENRIKKAFAIIEKARARALAESLGGANQPPENQNKASTKLTGKLEVLREELNWFYSRLSRAGEAEIETLQREAQRREAQRREKQIADVMRQIESTRSSASDAQTKVNSRDANAQFVNQLQNQLGDRKALIEFVNFDGELSAFVITGKKIQYAASLAKESEILALLEGLQFQFDAMRYGATSLGNFVGELKKRADFYLRKLNEKLFDPLEKFVESRNLVVVPVGALHYVPFHALFDGENYLIEKHEVAYSPSATVWQFLASKPLRKAKNAFLMGFADERIPFVNSEIEILNRIFPKAKSFTGDAATFAAFIENAPKFDVLHLACHGNFRPENPLFSSLHLADGWITVRDICAQRLKAEIVTLSACETGLNKIFAGDEILGLARGFLSAGAKSLVLSLWTVNDEAATRLMKTFYIELRTGKTASEALKIAQRNFIEEGVHPYFWSPFALIGT